MPVQLERSPGRLNDSRSVEVPPVLFPGVAVLSGVLLTPNAFLRGDEMFPNPSIGSRKASAPKISVRWRSDHQRLLENLPPVHIVEVVVLKLFLAGSH